VCELSELLAAMTASSLTTERTFSMRGQCLLDGGLVGVVAAPRR
jgi:hypothetical protein